MLDPIVRTMREREKKIEELNDRKSRPNRLAIIRRMMKSAERYAIDVSIRFD